MDKKHHKKRKKHIIHDMDKLVQFVWDDLDNIEKEIQELLNAFPYKPVIRSIR